MFSHVMIGTNDLDKAKAFYDALLGTLGVRPARVDGHRIFYITKTGIFSVTKPINGQPATPANGGTIGFAADSPEQAVATYGAISVHTRGSAVLERIQEKTEGFPAQRGGGGIVQESRVSRPCSLERRAGSGSTSKRIYCPVGHLSVS
jgi:catechol 2,3-dioxygenase-like lactoylglutathione lyase family enzyme